MKWRLIILILILLQTLRGYSQNIDSIGIVCQNELIAGHDFPLTLMFYFDGEINKHINGDYQIESENISITNNTFTVKKGVGTLTTSITSPGSFELKIQSTNFGKQISVIEEGQYTGLAGELIGETNLSGNTSYRISNDLIIPENSTLTIPGGVKFLIDQQVNIFVRGKIIVRGEKNNPVVFQSTETDKPWGGIILTNTGEISEFHNCFMIKGGANDNFMFGHSDSQAVIKAENSKLSLADCFIFDNVGKALGGESSLISISGCVISRSDTGGEFVNSSVRIDGSYIIDIPNGDGVFQDDDNDGFYFYGAHPSGEHSIVENSFFITGKDDGIDHNAAKLEIKNCWIEGFAHEGIACSNSNWVNVFNTLIKGCEQGIEAGYGSPHVTVDHCVMVNNKVGLRFGDGYDWGCNGLLTATNCITFNNTDNIKNFDLLSGGPKANSLIINHSITNDPEYDGFPGCFPATPLFDENYHLLPGSPGIGKAKDQTNIGLFFPITVEKQIKEYYIYCDPNDFEYLYQNYELDTYVPISIAHEGQTITQARMRIRGSGTRSLPKKSLKIKLDAGTFPDGIKVFNFNAEYEDKSYIQSYIMSKIMNASGLTCFNTNHVRLYLNDEFLGLYLSVENVDEDFLIKRGMDPGGSLYKATLDGASMSIYDNIFYHWEKKTGAESRDDLQEIIDLINSVSDEDYYQFVKTRFDYDKMINIIAVNLLTRNNSTYYHNYYLYHDINSNGKWEMLPWDLDKAFLYYGHNNQYHRSSKYWAPDNPFLERAILCEPVFDDIKTRIDELHNTLINDENLIPVIEELAGLLQSSVLEDQTDNVISLEEWLETIERAKEAFDVRYYNLLYQFENLAGSFRLERTKKIFYQSEDILFKWTPAIDPNGREISYTLFYGPNKNLDDGTANIIYSIRDTSYLLSENLEEGMYYWKVVATDGNYYIEGYDNYNIFHVSRSEEKVVINEINYNSSIEFNTGDWIELYNNSDIGVDISGWKFQDSNDLHVYTIPSGTVLGPGSYLVLCFDKASFQALFPDVNNCIGNFDFGLSGSGELIRLFNDDGLLIDSVVYDDELPWPVEADGTGKVLELIDPDYDNSLPGSWIASSQYGSPGRPNPSFSSNQNKILYPVELFQNFPNPFKHSTNIKYSFDRAYKIELVFYSQDGKVVHKTTPAPNLSGVYSYTWNTGNLSPGIYYYSLIIDGKPVKTNKAIKLEYD